MKLDTIVIFMDYQFGITCFLRKNVYVLVSNLGLWAISSFQNSWSSLSIMPGDFEIIRRTF